MTQEEPKSLSTDAFPGLIYPGFLR